MIIVHNHSIELFEGSWSVSALQRHAGSAGIRARTELRLAVRHPSLLRRFFPLCAASDQRRLRHSEDVDRTLLQHRLRRPTDENQPNRPHLPQRQEVGRTPWFDFAAVTACHLRRFRFYSRYPSPEPIPFYRHQSSGIAKLKLSSSISKIRMKEKE